MKTDKFSSYYDPNTEKVVLLINNETIFLSLDEYKIFNNKIMIPTGQALKKKKLL